MVEKISKYVTNIVKNLDIPRVNNAKMYDDLILNAIKTFEKHTRIRKIQDHMNLSSAFSFGYFTKAEVEQEMKILN